MRPRSAVRALLAIVPFVVLLLPGAVRADAVAQPAASGCNLPSTAGVKHVIYVQFDNVHFRRDDPNVPSDLEQMPNLLNFLRGQGALLTNHHTPLISHTANDIVTSLTGLYGDRQGTPVANSYLEYANPDGTTRSSSSFQYWTNTTPDGTFNMLGAGGTNTPAPWVPFTRAGCNVGGVGAANIEMEGLGDVAKVYGANSPEANEVSSHSPNAYPDFVGIAVHCAQNAALCAKGNHGAADALPGEPGGYSGFSGLFGHKYVAPQISSGPLKDLDGNVIADHFNGQTIPGFPGFDGMNASTSLAYTAAMQEHGVPVTFSYISATHDDAKGNDAGPGQVDYVARNRAYDKAWGTFFNRLAGDGITPANSLFVVTSDENDHFAGGKGAPAGCDGVHTPCTYNQIGEISTNLAQLTRQAGDTTSFAVHADTAPAIYLTGQPARDAAVTRQVEHTLAGIQVTNPISGANEKLFDYFTDPVGLRFEHMVTADPKRTPTLVGFAKPDYWVSTNPAACSPTAAVIECPPSFGPSAWMHGDISPDITTTWAGIVGPGIKRLGATGRIWSDHADLRPTILLLTGLKDDYVAQGRPLWELVQDRFLPAGLRGSASLLQLARAYKQINAPVGALGLAVVRLSTAGIEGDDATYAATERTITELTTERDQIAAQAIALIDAAAFGGGPRAASPAVAPDALTNQAGQLLLKAGGRPTAP
jgi:hypothetical protein